MVDSERTQVLKELHRHSYYDLTNLTGDYLNYRQWLLNIAYHKEAINMYLWEIDSIKQKIMIFFIKYIKNTKRCVEENVVAAKLTTKN